VEIFMQLYLLGANLLITDIWRFNHKITSFVQQHLLFKKLNGNLKKQENLLHDLLILPIIKYSYQESPTLKKLPQDLINKIIDTGFNTMSFKYNMLLESGTHLRETNMMHDLMSLYSKEQEENEKNLENLIEHDDSNCDYNYSYDNSSHPEKQAFESYSLDEYEPLNQRLIYKCKLLC
jgi:hypothetical protein